MKKVALILFLALSASFSIFYSCKKDDKKDNGFQPAKDNAVAETFFDDYFKQIDKAAKDTNVEKSGYSLGCPTITLVGSTFPKTLTLDFGTTCTDSTTGRVRSGKIIITLSKAWVDSGAVATCTFENYIVDGYSLSNNAVKTITNNGRTSGILSFTINVQNATITGPDGTFSWNTTRVHEFIQGENTPWPFVFDDVWRITGSANGVDVNSKTYTIDITSPLIVQVGCRWIKQGTLEVKPEEWDIITVDYGNGNCDAQATATYNGQTYNFVMN